MSLITTAAAFGHQKFDKDKNKWVVEIGSRENDKI
jgi:hypothetical protein